MNNLIQEFQNGVIGFFNNPTNPISFPYYVGFILTGILINLIWGVFTKKQSDAKSTKSVKIGNNNSNTNIRQ